MALPFRPARLLILAALMGAVVGSGCSANGDADPVSPAPATSATLPPDPPDDRPAFEAGFSDSGTTDPNADPTPDGGDTCVDTNDPGSSENTAKALPDTDDSQNAPITVTGVLNGPVDVDFYKLHVADTFGHVIEPKTELKTTGIEMCVFVKCPTGGANVTCNGGGVAKKSDIGTDGCCATGPSSATPSWDCKGADDDVTLYLRVRQTASKCTPYSFAYSF